MLIIIVFMAACTFLGSSLVSALLDFKQRRMDEMEDDEVTEVDKVTEVHGTLPPGV